MTTKNKKLPSYNHFLIFISALVIFIALIAAWSYQRLLTKHEWNVHTYRVLFAISQYDSFLRYDRGLTLCVTTGDNRLIEPVGWEAGLESRIAELSKLVMDNPAQLALVNALNKKSLAWRSEYVVPMQKLCQEVQQTGARKDVGFEYAAIASKRHEEIGEILRKLGEKEQALLKERQKQTSSTLYLTNTILILGLFVIVLMVFLFLRAQLRQTLAMWEMNEKLEKNLDELHQATSQLKASETKANAVIENVFDAIITFDANGVVNSLNRSAERIFGYKVNELHGQSLLMLFAEEHQSKAKSYFKQHSDAGELCLTEVESVEFEARHKSGRSFPIELSITEMYLNEQLFLIALMRDITERKRIDKLKTEFISTVSHELRTPLTSIRGSLGLVTGAFSQQVPKKALDLIEIASKNSERLVRLINDILDIEKIEAGEMRFDIKLHSISSLIQSAVQANQGYAVEHHVRLDIEEPLAEVLVNVDIDRFTQVMTNLLSNAAKFSPAGQAVEIRTVTTADEVMVKITDHGPGIPVEFQEKMFQKFSQADSSDTRAKGGTGLGLNICKAILSQMDGDIGFKTQAGVGTTMYFTLPVNQTPIASVSDNDGNSAGRNQILVCEDDADIANLLRIILQNAGYSVDIAYDADQALAMLDKGNYDALTLDIALPGKDGIALLHELHNHEHKRLLRVVVVSAKAQENRHLLNNGIGQDFMVVDWIDKPIDQARLLRSIGHGNTHSSENIKILHVEDDPDISNFVTALVGPNFEITTVKTLKDGLECVKNYRYDLIILDVGLPDGSGLSILNYLANQKIATPTLLFSALQLDASQAAQASATLVKSITSNQQLLDTINRLIQQKPSHDPNYKDKGYECLNL